MMVTKIKVFETSGNDENKRFSYTKTIGNAKSARIPQKNKNREPIRKRSHQSVGLAFGSLVSERLIECTNTKTMISIPSFVPVTHMIREPGSCVSSNLNQIHSQITRATWIDYGIQRKTFLFYTFPMRIQMIHIARSNGSRYSSKRFVNSTMFPIRGHVNPEYSATRSLQDLDHFVRLVQTQAFHHHRQGLF